MELHAAGILAALAATALATQCVADRVRLAVLLATVAGASVAFGWLGLPQVGPLAFLIAAAAAAALARPQWSLLPPIAGGSCAAAWISILHAQGLPWPPAALVAGAVLAMAVVLALRRAGFMSAAMRDEALVLVGCFALLLAVGPGVIDGWRSAIVLTAEPLVAQGPNIGPWLGALVVGCLLLGGVYTMWKRR